LFFNTFHLYILPSGYFVSFCIVPSIFPLSDLFTQWKPLINNCNKFTKIIIFRYLKKKVAILGIYILIKISITCPLSSIFFSFNLLLQSTFQFFCQFALLSTIGDKLQINFSSLVDQIIWALSALLAPLQADICSICWEMTKKSAARASFYFFLSDDNKLLKLRSTGHDKDR
jgi:hypothetical protein